MATKYVRTMPDGSLSILTIVGDDPDGYKLAKCMFNKSLTNRQNSHERFDPTVHTLATIAQGLPGHFPLTYRVCDDSELPASRYFRDAWEWID